MTAKALEKAAAAAAAAAGKETKGPEYNVSAKIYCRSTKSK